MTSKEALNSLEKLLKDLPYAVNLKEYHDAILKDLDRLEKLEKAIKILKKAEITTIFIKLIYCTAYGIGKEPNYEEYRLLERILDNDK